MRRRCRCHPVDAYATCIECPKCRHWSFDPACDACERRKCGYEVPPKTRVTETQTTLWFGR